MNNFGSCLIEGCLVFVSLIDRVKKDRGRGASKILVIFWLLLRQAEKCHEDSRNS